MVNSRNFGGCPRKSPYFGDGDLATLKQNFGDEVGTNHKFFLRFFGDNYPKILKFQGGDGDRIFVEFALTKRL